jgi:hypothetical protein
MVGQRPLTGGTCSTVPGGTAVDTWGHNFKLNQICSNLFDLNKTFPSLENLK